MRSIFVNFFKDTICLIMVITVVGGLFGGGYYFLNSDSGLLSDETLVAMISDDVLGNQTYGKSCPRSAYKIEVESRADGDKASGYFIFKPIEGQENDCPPIAFIANRRTAEVWIADPPK